VNQYEYLVQKVTFNNPTDASNRLSALGAQGWDVKYGTVSGGSIVLILQRPLDTPSPIRAAYKKAEAVKEKKEEEAKKEAARERMAKAREAKKAKANASKGA